MSLLLSVTEGWTGRLGPFVLKVDGTPQNLTGLTVALMLRGRNGELVTTTGDTELANQTTTPGGVYWDPDAADLAYRQSPYRMHFQVTDGDGKTVFFPNGQPDEIAVYQA